MILGILQTGHAPHEVVAKDGTYTDLFRAMLAAGHDPKNPFTLRTYSVVDGDFPTGPDAVDAWLITGSKHGVYENHSWIAPLETLIRAIADARRPLVGICFGHQIIAQALGGRVEKFAGGWTVGHQTYHIGGADVTLHAWHQDQVLELPPGATRLGWSETCENAVAAYGDHILTLQPHPEFSGSVIETLIACRGANVPKDRLARATAMLGDPVDNAAIARWIADVLRGHAVTGNLPFPTKAVV